MSLTAEEFQQRTVDRIVGSQPDTPTEEERQQIEEFAAALGRTVEHQRTLIEAIGLGAGYGVALAIRTIIEEGITPEELQAEIVAEALVELCVTQVTEDSKRQSLHAIRQTLTETLSNAAETAEEVAD